MGGGGGLWTRPCAEAGSSPGARGVDPLPSQPVDAAEAAAMEAEAARAAAEAVERFREGDEDAAVRIDDNHGMLGSGKQPIEKPYVCPCGISFAKEHGLKTHQGRYCIYAKRNARNAERDVVAGAAALLGGTGLCAPSDMSLWEAIGPESGLARAVSPDEAETADLLDTAARWQTASPTSSAAADASPSALLHTQTSVMTPNTPMVTTSANVTPDAQAATTPSTQAAVTTAATEVDDTYDDSELVPTPSDNANFANPNMPHSYKNELAAKRAELIRKHARTHMQAPQRGGAFWMDGGEDAAATTTTDADEPPAGPQLSAAGATSSSTSTTTTNQTPPRPSCFMRPSCWTAASSSGRNTDKPGGPKLSWYEREKAESRAMAHQLSSAGSSTDTGMQAATTTEQPPRPPPTAEQIMAARRQAEEEEDEDEDEEEAVAAGLLSGWARPDTLLPPSSSSSSASHRMSMLPMASAAAAAAGASSFSSSAATQRAWTLDEDEEEDDDDDDDDDEEMEDEWANHPLFAPLRKSVNASSKTLTPRFEEPIFPTHICNRCGRTYASAAAVRRHARQNHPRWLADLEARLALSTPSGCMRLPPNAYCTRIDASDTPLRVDGKPAKSVQQQLGSYGHGKPAKTASVQQQSLDALPRTKPNTLVRSRGRRKR